MIGQVPNLGTVVASSTGSTTFAWDTAGNVTVTGQGARNPAQGAVKIGAQLSCSSPNQCDTTVTVTIAPTGTPTNRGQALTNFTFGGGVNSTVKSQSGGTATLTLASGKSTTTFFIGAEYPITGDTPDSTSGVSTSPFQVTVTDSGPSHSFTPGGSVSASATATATVYHSIAISQTSPLYFGILVPPASGSGTVTVTPAGVLSTTGGVTALTRTLSPPTAASYNLIGEGGSTANLSLKTTSFTMTGTNSGSLVVTLSCPSCTSSLALGGSIGAKVTKQFGVGGSMTLANGATHGTYSGTFEVDVIYN